MMTEHESASGPTFYASRRRGGGAVSRARAVSAAIAMLLAVAGPGTVGARTPAPCGPFRVDWNRGELSPTAEKLEGFVYNDSSCSVTDVLLSMQLVGLGSAFREAIIAYQLTVHLGSDSVRSAVLALRKAQQSQPL